MTTPTLEERFWSKVEKSESGCWLWLGAKLPGGYGVIGRGPRGYGNIRAHRFAYELMVGPIPDGRELDHLCRFPSCVNPSHLEPVSHAENMRRSPRLGAFVAAGHEERRSRPSCKRGHAWTPENTYIDRRGARHCRACAREYQRRRQS